MLKPGDTFGDYRVVRLLGKGGMGSVFLLENAAGAQVATKILDPESAGDAESRKRFLREAELALGVKHPNLVETYDVGEDPDTGLCYILMEYVSGGSLADRIKQGPLPINDAIRITYQIASVLELAREKGIVHRDIKPDNIMFGADGKAKLADLGIARGGVGSVGVTTVTQTGMMIGTPAYMSPEQMLDSHNVDCRADIYSLGIVFFEMLTGERPNKDDTVVQLMAKVVAGEPIPDVRTLRPEISASVAELISLMCAMKADERVSTPAEVTLALSQIAHGREVTIRRKRPSAVQPAKRRKGVSPRLVLAILFGLAAAAGLAVFIYLGTKHASAPVPVRMQAEDPVRPVAIPDAPRPPPAHERPRPAPVSPQSVAESKPAPNASTSAPEVRKPAADQQPAAATGAPVSSEAEEHRLELERARAKLKPIAVEIAPGRRIEFVPCPAGTFTMGFNGRVGLHGLHKVTITRPFWIAKYPMTFADWKILTGEDRLLDLKRHVSTNMWRMVNAYGGETLPIGWNGTADANDLMMVLNRRFAPVVPSGYVFRLPTMAEWEHAFKCGDARLDDAGFVWGLPRHLMDDAVSVGEKLEVLRKSGMNIRIGEADRVFIDDRPDKDFGSLFHYLPLRIGFRPPNAWGICDMPNVGALTLDRWCTEKSLEEMHREDRQWMHVFRCGAKMQDGARDPLHWDVRTPHAFVWCRAAHPSNRQADATWVVGTGRHNWSARSCIRPVIGPDLLKERGIVPPAPLPEAGSSARPAEDGAGRKAVRPSEPKAKVAALPGKTFKLPKRQELELVGCPAGTFQMGYPGALPDRKASKVHEVRLTRPFWIGKHPVTREQWAALMNKVEIDEIDKALGGMKAPMTFVSGSDIAEFCRNLTRRLRGSIPKDYVFRLPTDAEWEYASRGGSDDPEDLHYSYSCSPELRSLVAVFNNEKQAIVAKAGITNIPKDRAWFLGPSTVCTKKPNGWGIYDMIGNVDEWVMDRFPIESPDGAYRKSGEIVLDAIDYKPVETDPLRWHDKLDATGIVRANVANGYPGVRRFCTPSSRFRIIGFRVVLGPDLEKERQSAAKRKTKKK